MTYCTLVAGLGLLCHAKWLTAQTPEPVSPGELVVDVRVQGNQTVTQTRILNEIKTRLGRPFSRETVEQDVRHLARLGWFVDVKPLYQQTPRGRVVIFQVTERPTLRYIKYLGNESVRDKIMARETGLKVGDALDPYAVEEGRRKIEQFYRERGYNKAQVKVLEGTKLQDRGAVFVINEGAQQRVWKVKFIGNTIASDSRLKTQIQSKPGLFWYFKGYVDRKKIDEDIDRLTAYYRSLGFFGAKIGRELEFSDSDKWLTLTFVIDEGPRYKIRNVSFLGNKRFQTSRLATGISLKRGDHFDQKLMNHDVSLLRDLYGSEGYVFADVKADPRFLEEPGQLDLVYNIDEGSRYRVGRITVHVQGDNPHTRIQTVLNRVSLRTGDIIDIREMRASERRLRASGLFANNPIAGQAPRIVLQPPGSQETQLAEERGRGARGQSPDPPRIAPRGQQVVDVQVHGHLAPAHHTAPNHPARLRQTAKPATNVVRMQSPDSGATRPTTGYGGYGVNAVSPGGQPAGGYPVQPSVTQAPVRTAALPGNAGGGVPQYTQPNFPQPHWDPNAPLEVYPEGLPVDIFVEETQTGRFMVGVGVNSDAGVLGNITLDEQNFNLFRVPRSLEDFRNGTAFRGRGQHFRLEAQPGSEVQRYLVSLQEPYLFDTPVSLGLSGFFFDRRFRDWDEQRYGGRVSLGYQLTPDLSLSVAYRGENVNIHDVFVPTPPELADAVGDNVLHGFRPTLRHDTRDSAFLATQGHLLELSFEQVIGTFYYPRAELDLRQYFLVRQRPDGSGRHVISVGGKVGFTGAQTPIYDHFFAGGFSTIRGFSFRGAAPRDPDTGVTVGGEFTILGSAEYLFPITADDMLRGVVFCDVGTVERDVEINDLRVAPGVGLRITVPALGPAPIALDFAFPVVTVAGDDEQIFSFNVGFLR